MTGPLTDALHEAQCVAVGNSPHYVEKWCEQMSRALRAHPDRLRIAASLLTVEDVAKPLWRELMKAGYAHRFFTAHGEEHTRTDAEGYAAAILAALTPEATR